MRTLLKWSAFLSAAGMFLILLMGALVTQTDSGLGCGREWPLCNGKFVPEHTISTLIEYSHRAVVGVVTLLLVLTTVLVWKVSKRKDAKWYAAGAVFFTLLQAVMGAAAVVWPQSSAVLALHFGLSLLAFACTFLLALLFTRWGADDAPDSRPSSPVSGLFRFAVWMTTLYTYGVVYLGAYVRHTDSAGGCVGWPLCNGEAIPSLSGATGIVFTHRVAAFVLFLCLVGLFLLARQQFAVTHNIYQACRAALALVVLQIFSGAFVTWTLGISGWYLLASMIHTVLISALFGVMGYLSVSVLRTQPAGVIQSQRSTA
jgi:cytochrome c oxidase assembly protein subunit 15